MPCLPDQSFRLLLNLEWLLLFTAVVMESLLPFQPSWFVLGRVVAIGLFGLLGLRLPMGKLNLKLIYTTFCIALILLASLQDGLSPRSIFLLFLVLVMRSCLIFKRIGQFVILAISLAIYAMLLLSKPIGAIRIAVWDWRLSNILMFSLTLVFALLLINALLSERQSRSQLEIAHQELAETHAQLRQYALRIEDQATLQERNRIAREIHDGLGHTLAAQTIQINNALLYWQSDLTQAVAFLKQAKQLGSEAFLEVRKSISLLRSNPLQGESLESALRKLFKDFQNTTGITITSTIKRSLLLSPEVSTALFRIAQESLTNISKHAQATSITVTLNQTGVIHLSIEDNGTGFDPTQNTTGFGLQGMQERTHALGGQFQIHSHSGNGCTIEISIPLSQPLS
jgi:signal transduction histidine kinase